MVGWLTLAGVCVCACLCTYVRKVCAFSITFKHNNNGYKKQISGTLIF